MGRTFFGFSSYHPSVPTLGLRADCGVSRGLCKQTVRTLSRPYRSLEAEPERTAWGICAGRALRTGSEKEQGEVGRSEPSDPSGSFGGCTAPQSQSAPPGGPGPSGEGELPC